MPTRTQCASLRLATRSRSSASLEREMRRASRVPYEEANLCPADLQPLCWHLEKDSGRAVIWQVSRAATTLASIVTPLIST